MHVPVEVTVEIVDPYTIYVSIFAAVVAFASVAYQFWRDFLSTLPKLRVLAKTSENNLSIGVVNQRGPVILRRVGLCVHEKGGKLLSAPDISQKFTVLAGAEVKTLENVLPAGFGPDIKAGHKFKVFVEVASGAKFYSDAILVSDIEESPSAEGTP